MIDKSNLLNHVTGCLIGAAIGDALARPANGLTSWQILRKFNFIDGFHSVNGTFGSYTGQSKMMLGFAHCMLPGGKTTEWASRLKEYTSKNSMPFASRAITIGIASALGDFDSAQTAELLKITSSYPENDRQEGVALMLVAKMIKECVLNSDKIARPYDLYDSSESVLEKMRVFCALNEDSIAKNTPLKDSLAERLAFVRTRLIKNDTFNSFVGINGVGVDYFESVPLALFAFMNEPDEMSSVYKTVSLGGAASQNAALVGAFVGGFLGIDYLHEIKEQVENSSKIHGLAAELVEAFMPTPIVVDEMGPTEEEMQ